MKQYLARAKTVIGFSSPVVGGSLLNMLASIIPVFFIAKLGKYDLAAAALATISFVTLLQLGVGLLNAVGVLISHQKESGNTDEIGLILRTGLLLCLLLALIFTLVFFNLDKLLLLLKQQPRLIHLAVPFFHYAGAAILFSMLTACVAQFYVGIGKPRVFLCMSMVATPLMGVLSYGFILGKLGLPKLGLAGMMVAMMISKAALFFAMLCILISSKDNARYGLLGRDRWISLSVGRKVIKLGAPISIQQGAELVLITIYTYMMGWFGADALSAAQIVNQFVIICVAFYIGCSQGISILSSRAYANSDVNLIKEYCQVGLVLMVVLFLVVAFVFVLYPVTLINLFLANSHIQHGEIIRFGRAFFIIAVITNFSDSIRFVISGAYRGMQDSKLPMYVGIFSLWVVSLLSSCLLAFTFHFGAIGLRAGMGVGFIFAAGFLLYHFFSKKIKSVCV